MPDSQDIPVLIGYEGELDGQRWTIQQPLTIGRDPACDIAIFDRQVSRHHARLTPGAVGVTLEDLGSKNGTHVNGERIEQPVTLQDGDVILIALAQKFVYLSSEATLALDEAVAPLESRRQQGRLYLDTRSRRVWVGEKEITPPLSASQYLLLEALYQHAGEVVSREALISAVWGEESAAWVSNQALDALVRRLRNRIAEFDPRHEYIVTVRGHGLRLDNPAI